MLIGIINYGMGNIGSIKKKIDKINLHSIISDKASELKNCDKLILPGVGHFGSAVKEIKKRNLWQFLNEEVLINKKPILGICLGMQLMANYSEEGDCEGFGWVDATVVRFKIVNKLRYKIPHVGWNQIKINKHHELFENVDITSGFYFVHSYYIKCNNNDDIFNETTYEDTFVSAIMKDHVIGLQYHPEKSHDAGEQLFKNILER